MGINYVEERYDVVVAGGGLAGMCAAVAAARNGARTAIVHNRPMFGGNASSEIRMHIVGANCHASKANLRETGILEELLLENKRRNPYASFHLFDMAMWELVYMEDMLTAYLNTNMDDVIMEGKKITAIICRQNTTETCYRLQADIFIDATGHGTLGVLAGASWRMGSEGRDEFGEPTAPEEGNTDTMGNSIMFAAVDRGEPVAFRKPKWAYTFTEENLKYRPHVDRAASHADGGAMEEGQGENRLPAYFDGDSGYWWIELGGQYGDIIRDGEIIRDELLKCVYGVWDHLKNGGDHGMGCYDLDWVGIVPGYRESRRLEGDYILTENDIRSNRIFGDAVAYGGWPMDIHVRGGLMDFGKLPSRVFNFEGCYTIPYRCYCSKDICNLMMAGRDISVSKMAFSSTRVMGTCAVGGQAVGTAAAMAARYGCTPRQVGEGHIGELQQQLLKDDCYIPGVLNQDPDDIARLAEVTATSEREGGEAAKVISGIARSVEGVPGCWVSGPLSPEGETLRLRLHKACWVRQVRLAFDTNLSQEIMPSITRKVRDRQEKGLPRELVRAYALILMAGGKEVYRKTVDDNGQRLNILDFDPVLCDEVRLHVTETYGCGSARVFEVRIYTA